MINLCFLSGIVKNEVDLKFIYDVNTKSLSKKHTTIVLIDLAIEKGQMVKACAYDKVAEDIYSNIQKDDFVMICGSINKKYIEISYCSDYNKEIS